MTTQEFSNEFDVLYNNIMSNQAPGLNEYEKSVFLTKAQYEIVKNYCNPKGNKYQEGVDGSPKRQIDFSSLLDVKSPDEIPALSANTNRFDNRSKLFEYPSEAWIPINEAVSDTVKTYQVIPLAYDDYIRLMSKPYKFPLKNQVWRLFNRSTTNQTICEIIGKFTGDVTYKIRFFKKPTPIITDDLNPKGTLEEDKVFIEKLDTVTECILPDELHPEILQRAVELAKAAYQGDINSTIEMGKRSE